MRDQAPLVARLARWAPAGSRLAQWADAFDHRVLRQGEIGGGRLLAAAERQLLRQIAVAASQIEREDFERRSMRRELIEMSPTLALQPKIYNATPGKPRERWLNVVELRALWQNLDDGVTGGGALSAGGRGIAATTVLSGSVANAIKFVVLTAVRRGSGHTLMVIAGPSRIPKVGELMW